MKPSEKAKLLFNLASFNNTRNQRVAIGDAAGVVLSRTLTYVDPTIFIQAFPELSLLNTKITIDNSGGYANTIQSLKITPEGEFNNSQENDTNKGVITLSGNESSIRVYNRSAKSTWRNNEVETAKMQNIDLLSQFLSAHNQIYQREVDKIGLTGMNGTTGLFGSGFTSTNSAKLIGDMTATEMFDTFRTLLDAQAADVSNTPEYIADTVITTPEVYRALNSTILNTGGSYDKSVLSLLKDVYDGVTFLQSFRAKYGIYAANSVTVAFSTNRNAINLRIPRPLEIGEIWKQGFRFGVESQYGIAGVDILENYSGRILRTL